jgi:hypothetical protein
MVAPLLDDGDSEEPAVGRRSVHPMSAAEPLDGAKPGENELSPANEAVYPPVASTARSPVTLPRTLHDATPR